MREKSNKTKMIIICIAFFMAGSLLYFLAAPVRALSNSAEENGFYVYKYYSDTTGFNHYDEYEVGFNDNFLLYLTKGSQESYKAKGPDGTVIEWRKGDPLPNPAPNGEYNGIPVVSTQYLFSGYPDTTADVSKFDMSNVLYMRSTFLNNSYIQNIDLSNWDTSKVTDMQDMFSGCENLQSVNLSGLNTSNVTDMSDMFDGCTSLKTLDLSGFDTSHVNYMIRMFYGCTNLTSVNLKSFDTSNVTSMNDMFSYCESLESLDLTNFLFRKNCSVDPFSRSETSDSSIAYAYTSSGAVAKFLNNSNPSTWDLSRIQFYAAPIFTDIHDGDYYQTPAIWAFTRGITSGTTSNTFSPQNNCTRGQAVTFLWKAAGSPEPQNLNSPFSDVVDPKAYYYKPVLWAVENGITSGTSDTTFEPYSKVTRAQFITFLWRQNGSPKTSLQSYFKDVNSGAFCEQAVAWAVQNGITNGVSYDRFGVNNSCTRGQVVTFLFKNKYPNIEFY